MLVTVSEQCDQKIMSLREEEKQGKKNKIDLYGLQRITKYFLSCMNYCTIIIFDLLQKLLI